jgi:guanylate kinase
VDGLHYHFWDRERFEAEQRAGGFLEWARVHGCCYGTLRREVEPYRERGTGVILVIDVQGAEQVRKSCPDAVSVFLTTSAPAILEQRLRGRGTEAEEVIRRRLAGALREMERRNEYAYEVINDDLDTAVGRLLEIVRHQFERGGHAG